MPLSVSCPHCDEPQSIPDESAGSTYRCTKCGDEFTAPEEEALEVLVVEEEVKKPSVCPQVVDDDDEDEPRERQPRSEGKEKKKKKKKAKKPATNPVLKWGVGIVSAVFAFVIANYLVSSLFRKDAPPPPDREMAGIGWYKVTEKDDWFTAYFPAQPPEYERHGFQIPAILAGKDEKPENLGWETQMWSSKEGGREYSIFLFRLPAKGSESDPKMAEQIAARTQIRPAPDVQTRVNDTITVGERTAKRVAIVSKNESKVSLMFGVGSSRILGVMVNGTDEFDHTDPKVVAFFENFTFNK